MKGCLLWFGLICLIAPALARGAPTSATSSETTASATGGPVVWLTFGLGMAYYDGDYAQLYQSGRFGYGLNGNVSGPSQFRLSRLRGAGLGSDVLEFRSSGRDSIAHSECTGNSRLTDGRLPLSHSIR